MVRYKHRYFLVEAERSRSVENLTIDINPLEATEDDIAKEIKNIVQDLHGDFGRASISSGFRVKYLNIATRVFLIRSRHGGPDKIISSSLPFIHNIRKENVVCRLLYTGATMRKSFIYLEKRQKRRLGELVNLLRNKGKYNKEELEKSILEVRKFGNKY
ncbi:ribonuclease P/MRP protein subunit POP5-like [Eurytemora carolleeae]|uniref:ribonuclease P/MRP protein subunit POP5-like n=1 Tax=Eurytemora carolleeae TaxID=1294199 RepID=UPI000C78523C|nr:ribonuclease P/MRP protein subunit POP5-like [Eurytemora carolleeae]XP_023333478.1 ribonuclease P/MRP protein subunit POP5-like [Eurytemora carolleeae]|eukprot:XP_023333477.1 ribonuclease P/MRP protein subunit POP5-like [Eurytemora affinis]